MSYLDNSSQDASPSFLQALARSLGLGGSQPPPPPNRAALASALSGQPVAPPGTHYAQLPGPPLLLQDTGDAVTAGRPAPLTPPTAVPAAASVPGPLSTMRGALSDIPGAVQAASGGQPASSAIAAPPSAAKAIVVPGYEGKGPLTRAQVSAAPDDDKTMPAEEDWDQAAKLAGAPAGTQVAQATPSTPAPMSAYEQTLKARFDQQEQLIRTTTNPEVAKMAIAEANKINDELSAFRKPGDTTLTEADRIAAGLPPGIYQRSATNQISPVAGTQEKDDKTAEIKDYEYSLSHPEFAAAVKQFKPQPNHVVGNNLVDPTGKVLFTAPESATLSPDGIDMLATRAVDGDNSGLVGMGRGKQGAQNLVAVQNRAAQIAKDKGIDPQGILDNIAEFGGQKAGARTAGQIGAKLDIFGESATNAADYAMQKSSEVPRGTWVPINQLRQMGERIASNTPLGVFNAANETLVNEYARAINAGSGQTTDTAKNHAYAMLNLADSPETYQAIANGLKWEINNVHAAAGSVAGKLRKGTGGEASPPPLAIPVAPGAVPVRATAAPSSAPPAGFTKGGYRFKGGDPSQQNNWEKVQ